MSTPHSSVPPSRRSVESTIGLLPAMTSSSTGGEGNSNDDDNDGRKTSKKQSLYPQIDLDEGEGEVSEFTYSDAERQTKCVLILSKKQLTVRLENIKKKYMYSFSTFLHNCTHMTTLMIRPALRLEFRFRQFASIVWGTFFLLADLLFLIGMSPTRSTGVVQTAAVLGVIPFIIAFVAFAIFAAHNLRNKILSDIRSDNPPKHPMAIRVLLVSVVLSLGAAIACLGVLAFTNNSPNSGGQNYDWVKYLNCDSDPFKSNDPYNYDGDLCGHKVLPWVRAASVLCAAAYICWQVGHFMYFGGQFLAFVLNYGHFDYEAKPVLITFYGTKLSGFPCAVVLALNDADMVRSLFYKYHRYRNALPIKMVSSGTQEWGANKELEDKDMSLVGKIFQMIFKIITLGLGGN